MKYKILIAMVVLPLGLLPSNSHAVVHYDIFKIEVTQAAHDGNHDYENPLHLSRAHLVCRKCKKDITLELVLIKEMEEAQAESEAYDLKMEYFWK
jgi:hypothetical protein